MRPLTDCYAIPTTIAMFEILRLPSSAHSTLIAVENFINPFGVTLVQLAFGAEVLSEDCITFYTLLGGLLNLLAEAALNMSHLFKLHPFGFTPVRFGTLIELVVAQFAPVEYFAAWSLDLTCMNQHVHFL